MTPKDEHYERINQSISLSEVDKEEHLHKGKVLTSEEVAIKLEDIEREEREQQTLEEFIQRQLLLGKYQGQESAIKYSILAGAQWQQQQIYDLIKELHDNKEITGFSKRAYAQCLDIVEQFKNK